MYYICIYGLCIFVKLKNLQAWNNCSLVLLILEFCCLNKFFNLCQSTFIGSNDWYHNLSSPNSVKQNLWTVSPSPKWCAFIQSLVQSKWDSPCSSGFPENSGLKWDQFECTNCCPCCAGRAWCSCCCGTCYPACAWADRVGVAGTPCACGPGSALSYLHSTNIIFHYFI